MDDFSCQSRATLVYCPDDWILLKKQNPYWDQKQGKSGQKLSKLISIHFLGSQE